MKKMARYRIEWLSINPILAYLNIDGELPLATALYLRPDEAQWAEGRGMARKG